MAGWFSAVWMRPRTTSLRMLSTPRRLDLTLEKACWAWAEASPAAMRVSRSATATASP